ncbi:MAG: pilus assembly protein N-terminal domain-containing protein [Phycisphaerales bacterium]
MFNRRSPAPQARAGRLLARWVVLGAGLPLSLLAAGAAPQPPAQPDGVMSAAQVDQAGHLGVLLGQSRVVRPPFPAMRVSVTDPTVADVEVLTPDQVLVLGKKPGTTDLLVWSQDERVWRTRIEVGLDLERLRGDLASAFPDAELSISRLQNLVVISGQLRRADDASHLKEFMDKTEIPYLNRTSLAGIQQVQIRVRVAEVSRQALRTLGVNTYMSTSSVVGGIGIGPSIGGAVQPAVIAGPQAISPPPGPMSISPAVTVFGGLWRGEIQLFVQALAENQYLRVLAEPTLNCASGEEATFLAGGEFPIPVVQGSVGGAGGGTSISIEYKPFGVNLRFRPVVLGDNSIRLHVAPEVSDLSDVGAVTIQGFRIPSIQTRRAETTLELKSGQTFALAGLINQRIDARNSRVPGFGDLPILGALFRSVRYNQGDTELLIMVTANLVSADNIDGRTAAPGDLHNAPNDWELFATGKLEGKAAPPVSPADAQWLREQGLDQLQGPGAWAAYDAAPARGTATARPSTHHAPPGPPPARAAPEPAPAEPPPPPAEPAPRPESTPAAAPFKAPPGTPIAPRAGSSARDLAARSAVPPGAARPRPGAEPAVRPARTSGSPATAPATTTQPASAIKNAVPAPSTPVRKAQVVSKAGGR